MDVQHQNNNIKGGKDYSHRQIRSDHQITYRQLDLDKEPAVKDKAM